MIPARSDAINNSRTVLHDDPDVTTRNGGVRRSQARDPSRRVERLSWPPTPPATHEVRSTFGCWRRIPSSARTRAQPSDQGRHPSTGNDLFIVDLAAAAVRRVMADGRIVTLGN